MKQIILNEKFDLVFKCKLGQKKAIEKILDENKFESQLWKRLGYESVIEFRVPCNLRKAEIIRRLLKNFVIYE